MTIFKIKKKSDILDIKSSPNVLIFADKISNIYKAAPQETLQKHRKKIQLSDRTESLAKTPAFIILKDHKDNSNQVYLAV